MAHRSQGPMDTWPDVRVEVKVTLVGPGSCAAVWVRFTVVEFRDIKIEVLV